MVTGVASHEAAASMPMQKAAHLPQPSHVSSKDAAALQRHMLPGTGGPQATARLQLRGRSAARSRQAAGGQRRIVSVKGNTFQQPARSASMPPHTVSHDCVLCICKVEKAGLMDDRQ